MVLDCLGMVLDGKQTPIATALVAVAELNLRLGGVRCVGWCGVCAVGRCDSTTI